MTSSTKWELHNILQRHQSRSKLLQQAICTENLVMFGHVVAEIYACRQKDTIITIHCSPTGQCNNIL